MQSDTNKKVQSVARYHFFLENIHNYIEEVLRNDVSDAVNKIASAERIFLLGKGSSVPAILFLTQELKYLFPFKRIEYISDFSLIEGEATKKDLFILNSYSASTSDATNILSSNAYSNLVLLSANTEKKEVANKNISFLELYPKEEKLFSRPASLITSFMIVCKIVSKIKNADVLPMSTVTSLLKKDFLLKKMFVQVHEKNSISVLYAGENLPFAHALSLAFNEGIGKKSDYFSIDEFIHGWWVPMFLKPNEHTFFLLDCEGEKLKKIKKFLRSSGVKIFSFSGLSKDKYALGLLYLLQTVFFIDGYNQEFNYDMNNPIGKEAIKNIY